MKQKGPRKQMETKSRDWLEAECLRLANETRGGREIQRVIIRRLNPKGAGPNWKAADLIPLPALALNDEVRATFAHLPETYALDVDNE
jgi:uncharacterized protein YeaO (DUF488 family)